MTETDNNSQAKKAEIYPWAVCSLILALLSLPGLLLLYANRGGLLGAWLAATAPCIMLGAIIAALMGVLRIRKSKGALKGMSLAVVGAVVGAGGIVLTGWILLPRMPGPAWQLMCGTNLRGLGSAMRMYASDFGDKYPPPDKWCDLLVEHGRVVEKHFICASAGKGRCHYAMNPNCEPSLPGDTVLLFETKGGWNQHGGPEILTTENHEGKGCNILFNDGSMRFVSTEGLDRLKWNVEKDKK